MVKTRSKAKEQSSATVVNCIIVGSSGEKCSVPEMANTKTNTKGVVANPGTPVQSAQSASNTLLPTSSRFTIGKIFFKPKTKPPDPAKIAKPINPPPINVFNTDGSTIKNLLGEKIAGHTIKHLRNCVQVFSSDTTKYNDALNLFKASSLDFYTYPIITTPMTRFVVTGLYDASIADIIDDLEEYGFHPVEITKMQLNKPKANNTENFLVKFDEVDKVTLAIIQRAKYLCHTVVNWSTYRPSHRRYKICRNCFRMNHGTTACFMPARCMFCAEGHKSADCPLLADKRNKGDQNIAKELLVCANCSGQHTAADPACPNIINFLAKKLKKPDVTNGALGAPPQPQYQRTQPGYMPAPTPSKNPWNKSTSINPAREPSNSSSNIQTQSATQQLLNNAAGTPNNRRPSTSTVRRPPQQVQFVPQFEPIHSDFNLPRQPQHNNTPVTSNRAYNSNLSIPIQNNTFNANNNSNVVNVPTKSINDNLFTAEETLAIFQDMVTSIRACNSKEEQLQALMNLALKWL